MTLNTDPEFDPEYRLYILTLKITNYMEREKGTERGEKEKGRWVVNVFAFQKSPATLGMTTLSQGTNYFMFHFFTDWCFC